LTYHWTQQYEMDKGVERYLWMNEMKKHSKREEHCRSVYHELHKDRSSRQNEFKCNRNIKQAIEKNIGFL
jgi:hypothetical protein